MSALYRLLLVTSDFHYRRGGAVFTTSAFMRFVPELLAFADEIEVAAPIHPDSASTGFSIESPVVRYLPLPPSAALEEFLRRLPRDGVGILGSLYKGMRRADIVWINGPHPLLVLSAALARALRKRHVLWIRGDIRATVPSKYRGAGLRRAAARRTAVYLDRAIECCAVGAVVFYTGRGLDRYGERARYSMRANTSLVKGPELASVPHTELHDPVRLLWAGQLRPVKGLAYLLEAVSRLRAQGYRVVLTLIGEGEQRAELEAECRRLGVEAAVRMPGYVPPGAALTEAFTNADIYVLPSLSEGIPKVLIEAMAQGLPVVSTEVGGIADMIVDRESGLLIEPRSAEAIRGAVEELILDASLRRRVAAGALEYARLHTAEAEVARIRSGLREAYPDLEWHE